MKLAKCCLLLLALFLSGCSSNILDKIDRAKSLEFVEGVVWDDGGSLGYYFRTDRGVLFQVLLLARTTNGFYGPVDVSDGTQEVCLIEGEDFGGQDQVIVDLAPGGVHEKALIRLIGMCLEKQDSIIKRELEFLIDVIKNRNVPWKSMRENWTSKESIDQLE